ncbi:low specificity L-threonine aldolase [Zooshikella marina]|uniref:threonine aldolase family protein n=1 Tax=Zooshikella ganghwensis TaxID=202772 RepID=UPI001BAE6E20|nr:low specificity L-threonine aldolase [Zooshikella ganghwensis]MBU2708159.1 low specificity L-threonine aldolase [Zooshikella ganghwensis]
MTRPGQFASDNYSGICPEALEYMLLANEGDAEAYGEDEWTRKACDEFRRLFETDCDVFFAFNGTAANSLALASLCQSYHSVIAHQTSHVETDECGAPEFFSNGSKLLLGDGAEGKLSPESIAELACKRTDIHYPKPKVISITQATEQGTVYTIDELRAIKDVADRYQLKIHMDGARFANACVSLGKSPAELSWKQGVDVLCFSGTKNGMAIGEAIVFFDKQLAEDFSYRIKQAGQLASKMRFLSAPWLGMLKTGAWEKNAKHANQCATYLAERLCEIPGVSLLRPCEANAVFVVLPEQVIVKLREQGWRIYTFIGAGGARFVCSWNSDKARIDQLISDIKQLMAK